MEKGMEKISLWDVWNLTCQTFCTGECKPGYCCRDCCYDFDILGVSKGSEEAERLIDKQHEIGYPCLHFSLETLKQSLQKDPEKWGELLNRYYDLNDRYIKGDKVEEDYIKLYDIVKAMIHNQNEEV